MENGTIVIACTSLSNNYYPETKSVVRGELIVTHNLNKVAGWVLESINENQTKAIYISIVNHILNLRMILKEVFQEVLNHMHQKIKLQLSNMLRRHLNSIKNQILNNISRV